MFLLVSRLASAFPAFQDERVRRFHSLGRASSRSLPEGRNRGMVVAWDSMTCLQTHHPSPKRLRGSGIHASNHKGTTSRIAEIPSRAYAIRMVGFVGENDAGSDC